MRKKIICIFVMTLLIVTVSPAVGIMNVFPSNNSLIEKTGAEDYMMTNWYEHKKLVASDGTTANGFGDSVSIDGDYAFIGAWNDDDNGFGSGSAYVFKRDGPFSLRFLDMSPLFFATAINLFSIKIS